MGRVLRGGSWDNNARNCRSANRNRNNPDNRNNNIGFRVASASAAWKARICQNPILHGEPERALLKPYPASCPMH